jgi:uncharacterized membrane protein
VPEVPAGNPGQQISDVILIIWTSILVGGCASAAALYGYYLVLPGWLTGPEICQLEAGGCQVLFRSPRARLLGVPNASLGVLLYALLATGMALGWPPLLLFAMTWPAIAMSVVLAYSLISNRRQCRICWAGHVANATLFVVLGLRALG